MDYILSNKHNLGKNVEVLNTIQFRSDHRLVRATLTLKNAKKIRRQFTTIPRTPKSKTEINNYLSQLATNIDNNVLYAEVQSYYNMIEKCIIESLKTNQEKTKKNKILSEQTLELIQKRTDLIHTKNKTREMKKTSATYLKLLINL